MCLILLAWQAHPDYPLVLVANRDEFHARPAAPARFWAEHPQVLAGRDLSASGTWLGMTLNGRFAALTNFRDPAQVEPGRPSRGTLVAEYLSGHTAPGVYLQQSAEYGRQCNGYNLLVGRIDPINPGRSELFWASNVSGEMRALAPGIYGLSNHLLDTAWPKVRAGKTALEAAVQRLPDETALRTLLLNSAQHPDEQLPATGVPLEWERALSAAFIRLPGYGTRASTLLKVSAGGTAIFDEQTWGAGGETGEQRGERRRYAFALG